MIFQIKSLVADTWGLMTKTSLTWEQIFHTTTEQSAFKRFFLFFLSLTVVLVFVFKIVYDEATVQNAVLFSVVTALAYLGAYFLTIYFAMRYFKRKQVELISFGTIEKIVAYSFVIVFAIKQIVTIIPSLFFLQILNIYTFYIIWEGCKIGFNFDEDQTGKLMLLIGFSIILFPAIISKVLFLMLPSL